MSLAGKSMADGKIPWQEPDLYELIGKKLLVPKNTWSNPKEIFGDDVDGLCNTIQRGKRLSTFSSGMKKI